MPGLCGASARPRVVPGVPPPAAVQGPGEAARPHPRSFRVGLLGWEGGGQGMSRLDAQPCPWEERSVYSEKRDAAVTRWALRVPP